MEDKIDINIKPTIDVMNNTGWIETVSSCEGHNGDTPYVAFFCRKDKIEDLSNILNNISEKLVGSPFLMQCNLVFEECVVSCQLDFIKLCEFSEAEKLFLLALVSNEFQN